MNVQELARRLGAAVDPAATVEITGVATIDEAGPSDVTFLANERYAKRLPSSRAGAVLVAPDFKEGTSATPLRIANPYLAFAKAIGIFHPASVPSARVHPTAVVGEGCSIGRGVSIGAHCVIGNRVRIGDGTVVHPHVVVYDGAEIGEGSILHSFTSVREGVRMGKRVIVQNGAVVGADGFGFAPVGDGTWHKIPQVGTVVIGDDVEIQANACIDRATVGTTKIGRGSKVDNLVQVGHGSKVGEDTLLCGQVGLAGSSDVGNRVTLAGQVGVAGHLRIADGVTVGAQSGVGEDLEENQTYFGSPAIKYRAYGLKLSTERKLPDLIKRFEALEKRLAAVDPAS